jgi:phospholipid/cholesterol/gamma-HCH transport system substrate-binding protein
LLRRWIIVLIAVVGLAGIAILVVGNLRLSRQELKSCFSDVQGLKAGAGVRIAGVDVGTVRSVRAIPQNKNCPAEVEMALATSYELRVPQHAIAAIEQAGILGERYVDIDISQASGPPVENYGYLKGKTTKPLSAEDVLRAVDKRLTMIEASIKSIESEKTSKGSAAPHSQHPKP